MKSKKEIQEQINLLSAVICNSDNDIDKRLAYSAGCVLQWALDSKGHNFDPVTQAKLDAWSIKKGI